MLFRHDKVGCFYIIYFTRTNLVSFRAYFANRTLVVIFQVSLPVIIFWNSNKLCERAKSILQMAGN